jgi:UDP-N-acetylglucosamine 2-epimerase (non-hydrolysing)
LHSGIGIYWNLKYSGGIQEETTYLGIPCVTLRTTTERPVTVETGTNYLVGEDTQAAEIVCLDILNNNFKKGQIPEFWDGHAAERIVEVLVDKVNGEFVNGE